MNNLLPEVQADNPFGTYVEEEEEEADHQHQHQHHHVALDLVEEKGDQEEAMENIVRKEESAAPSKAKARWKSSVELVSSGRKKEWVPDSDMVDFFSTITKIDDLVKEMESGVHKLEATHLRSKVATTPAVVRSLRDEMAEEITRCALRSKDALNLFKQIEGARKGKLSALSQQKLRMRQTILDAKRRQFKKTMAKFSQLRLEVQADYKEIVARRYATVTGEEATDRQLEEMIETGESEQIFQRAILEQGRGAVQDTLSEIDERHRSVKQVERGLLELQQVFLDLATVVDQQGEVLDNIERHVSEAGEFTSEGAKALQVSVALHKSIQRKKLCIVILVVIGVVILAAILYPIVKTIVDQAQTAEQTKAAKRQAAAEEARVKLERMGINDRDASAGG